jgi:hypothetical protein
MAADDAEASPKTSKAKPDVAIPSVSSTGQRSGVTAGYVHQLSQTVLPTLVRGPQLEKFKTTFAQGARLYRDAQFVATNEDVDRFCSNTNLWANDALGWLQRDVSTYAAERFVFQPTTISLMYNISGVDSDRANKWGRCREYLSTLLVNLDQLMRDPSIYPEASPK